MWLEHELGGRFGEEASEAGGWVSFMDNLGGLSEEEAGAWRSHRSRDGVCLRGMNFQVGSRVRLNGAGGMGVCRIAGCGVRVGGQSWWLVDQHTQRMALMTCVHWWQFHVHGVMNRCKHGKWLSKGCRGRRPSIPLCSDVLSAFQGCFVEHSACGLSITRRVATFEVHHQHIDREVQVFKGRIAEEPGEAGSYIGALTCKKLLWMIFKDVTVPACERPWVLTYQDSLEPGMHKFRWAGVFLGANRGLFCQVDDYDSQHQCPEPLRMIITWRLRIPLLDWVS